ncbi:hypothetical protein [Microcoleus sp. T2B6]|uniref:hypothetical protein n=1 Tax=Microcoleus sp. T2B6 TaxID=3055424 RepID=UPI002FD6BE09
MFLNLKAMRSIVRGRCPKLLFTPVTHILHPCQQQAFRPVPQENLSFVEQAEKPVHKG